MGFRYRKSVRIMPGVRLNISKSGVSTSIGGKGATVNLSKRGTRTTIGAPGTGVSYSHFQARKRSGEQPLSSRSSSPTSLKLNSVSASVLWCAVSLGLVLLCQLPAMDSALIRYLCYACAGLSVLMLIGALVEARTNTSMATSNLPIKRSLPEEQAAPRSELRPIDRVWGWYIEAIQTFSAEDKQKARALYEAGDAHSLDLFCRECSSSQSQQSDL